MVFELRRFEKIIRNFKFWLKFLVYTSEENSLARFARSLVIKLHTSKKNQKLKSVCTQQFKVNVDHRD